MINVSKTLWIIFSNISITTTRTKKNARAVFIPPLSICKSLSVSLSASLSHIVIFAWSLSLVSSRSFSGDHCCRCCRTSYPSILVFVCHIVNRVVGRDAPPPDILRMISLWTHVRTASDSEARSSLPVILKSRCCWCNSGYAISFIAVQSGGPRSPCHSLADCSYRLSAPTPSYAGRCGREIFFKPKSFWSLIRD